MPILWVSMFFCLFFWYYSAELTGFLFGSTLFVYSICINGFVEGTFFSCVSRGKHHNTIRKIVQLHCVAGWKNFPIITFGTECGTRLLYMYGCAARRQCTNNIKHEKTQECGTNESTCSNNYFFDHIYFKLFPNIFRNICLVS